MRRFEKARHQLLALAAVAAMAPCFAASAESLPQRYSAPIERVEAAPFVEMALPPAAYAHSQRADLGDLRVVDARGDRVPFALLAPRTAPSASERTRAATLYPLPPRAASGTAWPSPVEVLVQGDRISVRRTSQPAAKPNSTSAMSPGWLLDLGEALPGESAPRRLRLAWSGPAEFSAAYVLETSDDLRLWRGMAGGQLMALQSASGALTQPLVPLGDRPGRFIRLVWSDAAAAPMLTGATVLAPGPDIVAIDAATELVFAPSAEPAGSAAPEAAAGRALQFDLGGNLPIVDLDLRFASGTRVAPVRLQGRVRVDEPWQELGSGVFYRLERATGAAESPAIAMQAQVRYLRVIPDERTAMLDPAQVRLVVHALLASLVFVSGGEPPFRLLAGSPDAAVGALPASTLVPRLDEERSRFGHATLGVFSEVPEVARAADRAAREALYRPWLLWSVLLIGVALLGTLVWRLARAGQGSGPPHA